MEHQSPPWTTLCLPDLVRCDSSKSAWVVGARCWACKLMRDSFRPQNLRSRIGRKVKAVSGRCEILAYPVGAKLPASRARRAKRVAYPDVAFYSFTHRSFALAVSHSQSTTLHNTLLKYLRLQSSRSFALSFFDLEDNATVIDCDD